MTLLDVRRHDATLYCSAPHYTTITPNRRDIEQLALCRHTTCTAAQHMNTADRITMHHCIAPHHTTAHHTHTHTHTHTHAHDCPSSHNVASHIQLLIYQHARNIISHQSQTYFCNHDTACYTQLDNSTAQRNVMQCNATLNTTLCNTLISLHRIHQAYSKITRKDTNASCIEGSMYHRNPLLKYKT